MKAVFTQVAHEIWIEGIAIFIVDYKQFSKNKNSKPQDDVKTKRERITILWKKNTWQGSNINQT